MVCKSLLLQTILLSMITTHTNGKRVLFKDINTYNAFVTGNNKTDYKIYDCDKFTDVFLGNCPLLKKNGFCKSHGREMLSICPRTCEFCKTNGVAAARFSCKDSKYGCCRDKKTPALGPNGAACPENCQDVSEHRCKFFQKVGFCENYYKQTMIERCPVTCKFCKPLKAFKPSPLSAQCHDDWRNSAACQHFSKRSLCNSRLYSQILKKSCRQACGFCVKEETVPDIEDIDTECLRNEKECCWDLTTPKEKGCPKCKDKRSKKYCKPQKEYCNDFNGIRGVFVRIFCPETCALCETEFECIDNHFVGLYCPVWKAKGYCKEHPYKMSKLCKKTCNDCGP